MSINVADLLNALDNENNTKIIQNNTKNNTNNKDNKDTKDI